MGRDTSPVLEVRDLDAGYGRMQIIRDGNLVVAPGELVTVIGPNGAGKSTLLKSILGFCTVFRGAIIIAGQDVTGAATHERVALGIGYVPQGRQVFDDLTVEENLRMGGFLIPARADVEARTHEMYELFPRLVGRRAIRARMLSGGEQQMLAMARALMTRPQIVLLDEPTLGLAPVLVEQVMEHVVGMRNHGLTMLMIEQNATMALGISDRAYVVDDGTTSPSAPAADLLRSDTIRRLYLGAP